MKTKIIYILLALLLPTPMWSSHLLQQADDAYKQSNYTQAIKLYESYLKDSVNYAKFSTSPALSDCYYNLGNCYYRSKDWGKAVLNYHRAVRVNPQNDDAAFNLELTQAKLKDQFDTPSEMFFLSWMKSVMHSKNATQWGLWALCFLILTLILFLFYFLGKQTLLRKLGLYGGTLCAIFLLLFHLFAYLQRNTFEEEAILVVMDNIHTYEAPSNTGKELQNLHEGTTLLVQEVIDTPNGKVAWYNVTLPNGMEVWVKNENVELVADVILEQKNK